MDFVLEFSQLDPTRDISMRFPEKGSWVSPAEYFVSFLKGRRMEGRNLMKGGGGVREEENERL